uniref:Uncharacterized protein n=1 Tax=viral metagenome TaxID=1070528 RepID=A0A6C0KC59_9ZZZZ
MTELKKLNEINRKLELVLQALDRLQVKASEDGTVDESSSDSEDGTVDESSSDSEDGTVDESSSDSEDESDDWNSSTSIHGSDDDSVKYVTESDSSEKEPNTRTRSRRKFFHDETFVKGSGWTKRHGYDGTDHDF